MAETHVVLADAHFPFQDEAALSVALKVAKAAKPDTIWLLGDMLDFATISRFRDAERYEHTVQDEIDELVAWLVKLRHKFPEADLRYMLGNHERRLKYYLWGGADKVKHLRTNRFEHQFRFDHKDRPIDLGLKFQTGRFMLTHNFALKHGARSNLYSTRWEYEDEGRSGMSGHMHRSGMWAWSRPGTGLDVWHGVACLCDLDPMYRKDEDKPSPWNHGEGVLTKDGSRVGVENVIIDKGTAIWRGRSFTA